jgi:hypothetical protein
VKEEKVVLYPCLHNVAITGFQAEVVKALTERLSGLESIPEKLVDKIKGLGRA